MNNEPNPDQRGRMVADALKALSHDFKPMTLNDSELIMKRAMEIAKAVKAIIKPLDEHVHLTGIQHDVKVMANLVSKAYTEGFCTWSKDELLYLLVLMHTEMVIESVTGQTNTAKIVKPI